MVAPTRYVGTAIVTDAKLTKHSITIQGHQTSVTLESIFWDTLKDLAESQSKTIKHLIEEIDAARTGNLSSAIRVYVIQQIKSSQDV